MRPMIEPAAGRLFDIYYQYTSKEDLTALQSLIEEAYKVHERLKKFTRGNKGFFSLDEFLLLKALRNYSVHTDEILGKSYGINKSFLAANRMDLGRVCLVEKQVVHQAINQEPILDTGESDKVSRLRNQLVDMGEHYNIEPVIFNFMVKVYELMIKYQLSIPGQGFIDIDTIYKKEIYHNYPHYVPLKYSKVCVDALLNNLIPLNEITSRAGEGLQAEELEPYKDISFLAINYHVYKPAEFDDSYYGEMRETVYNKVLNDSELTNLSITLPKHLGWGFVSSNETTPPLTIKRFNISKQRAELERNGIILDSYYYETTPYELLVLFIYKETIFPVVISKDELIKRRAEKELSYEPIMSQIPLSQFKSTTDGSVKVNKSKIGRNDPCICGSGKKYKKCCLH